MTVYLFKVIATEGRTNELRRESNLRSEAARARSEGRREEQSRLPVGRVARTGELQVAN